MTGWLSLLPDCDCGELYHRLADFQVSGQALFGDLLAFLAGALSARIFLSVTSSEKTCP
jgi:hypothetical protein